MISKQIKAICFDMDGVIIPACESHYIALNKALKLFGYNITEEEHNNIFNGLPTVKKLEILSEKNNLPVKLHKIIRSLKKKYTDDLIPSICIPSTRKQIMFKELKKRYKIACCSNAIKESVVEMLTRSRYIEYFDLILGNDEIKNPKPDPEIYLTAFKKLGVLSQECLIIEDAPYGIEAGKKSGATVIEVQGVEDVYLSLFNFYI